MMNICWHNSDKNNNKNLGYSCAGSEKLILIIGIGYPEFFYAILTQTQRFLVNPLTSGGFISKNMHFSGIL